MKISVSGLEDHLGYWLRLLSNAVSSSFAQRMESHGVSVAQWVVLRILFDRKDCSLVELAQVLDMDKGGLSRMIDRLLKLDLVKRTHSAKSRREVALSLTARAQALVPLLAKEADENDQSFFDGLTQRQRIEFLKIIKLLIASRLGQQMKLPLE